MNAQHRVALWALSAILGATLTSAQAPAPAAQATHDEALEAANAMIGRATILRGFPAGTELRYNAQGNLQGQFKPTDWTLAAVDIQKVTRQPTDNLQMEGIRVAIRYNLDQHTFDRRPLKETRIRIDFPAPDAQGARAALAAIFSVGIDPALQRSMPPAWKHLFIPATEWTDDLAGQTILPPNAKPSPGLQFPVLLKKAEPEFTPEAIKDRVKGIVQMKLVVGVDGIPRRIALRLPVGYGLDERAVEAAAKYRFQPGSQDGKPVPMEVIVNQAFDVPPPK